MVLPRPEGELERAFEKYFAKVGAVLHVEVLIYSGRPADQPALVAQLRRLAPDLIYTWDTPTTLAVAGPVGGDPVQYIRNIPVVFTSVSDPIAAGLVSNLERPGRNVTGVIPLAPLPTSAQSDRCLPSTCGPWDFSMMADTARRSRSATNSVCWRTRSDSGSSTPPIPDERRGRARHHGHCRVRRHSQGRGRGLPVHRPGNLRQRARSRRS